jgi:hypothetical protein
MKEQTYQVAFLGFRSFGVCIIEEVDELLSLPSFVCT